MKKLVLSLAIVSALGLSGCGSETIEDVKKDVAENGTPIVAPARVVFDPSKGVLSVPNDLLFSGTPDGTLHIPTSKDADGNYLSGEQSDDGSELDSPNYAEPSTALGALDGWSTTNPFVLDINFPTGTSLDSNSVLNTSSVQIFETLMGGAAGCEEVPLGAACQVVSELVSSVDYITQASGNSVSIIPLKPLKAKTTYIVALTNNLLDNNGKAVAGSTTYESVRQDITEHPMATEAQLGLQAVINSYENAIVAAGADKDSLIYTMALTTQSTTDALATAKALMANNVPTMYANAMQGTPTILVKDTTKSVADILAPYPVGHELFDENIITQDLIPLYSTANFMQGSITLPYYLGVPKFDEDGELIADTADAPLNGWWKSLCDSGAILAGVAGKIAAGELPAETIPTDAVSVDDGTCQALGLRSLGFDTKRHLTKYSPVPKANADMAITVQMTTPDVAVANDVREDLKLPTNLVEPENGWPVVILQHGITSKKEDMLAITGILSIYGFATVAIDHPLHGSRGFDTDMDGIDDINASTVSATDYMNLASLLTTRDNLRQSTSDLLGLRLGMNFLGGEHAEGDAINIDTSKVHFLGHSLGAITGINFIGLTNTALDPEVDPLFAVNTNSLAMPGVMVANFLLESGAFGGLVKSSLAYAASPDFQGFVALAHQGAEDPTADPTEAEMVGYYQSFYALLTPEQQAGLDGTFAAFAFAAQTVTDAGDPANYAAMMAATNTPTHLIEVIGNGSDNLSDQVIPNSASFFGGTEGAITLLGLSDVSEIIPDAENPVSGAVRFLFGHHGSILSPSPRDEAPDAVMTGAATSEMQSQVANFFNSDGHLISVTNGDVVQ